MKYRRIRTAFPAAIALALAAAVPAVAQHGHLNAGATGTNPNDALVFANGDHYARESGYVQIMPMAASGTYRGLYNSGPTLTVLPQTVDHGGPVPGAPALGSFIEVQIEWISGPAGGVFSFWDHETVAPTVSLTDTSTGPSPFWALSDASLGAGQSGADPYGHIHGRRFTATELGVYSIGFRLADTSANGPGGGPIHLPSDWLVMNFQAVPEPGLIALLGLACAGAGWRWGSRRIGNTWPARARNR